MLVREKQNAKLFDRDAFGEIARLIDVGAAMDRNMVREQLKRNSHDDRRKIMRSLGQRQRAMGGDFGGGFGIIRQYHDLAAA